MTKLVELLTINEHLFKACLTLEMKLEVVKWMKKDISEWSMDDFTVLCHLTNIKRQFPLLYYLISVCICAYMSVDVCSGNRYSRSTNSKLADPSPPSFY